MQHSSYLLATMNKEQLLTEPFLQLPTETSIQVIWFTEFFGTGHQVRYGEKLEKMAPARTSKLTRVREDAKSRTLEAYQSLTDREIWRHQAEITDLNPGERIPYQVTSFQENKAIRSDIYTLTPRPKKGTNLKILLTSDHQLMPMTAANLQKVIETIGQVDAVFLAGDLVNIPDRASEWFDDSRGGAFFPCLQGRANYTLTKNGIQTIYKGGEIIQNAPLFPAIGNHEVMGRFSNSTGLNEQFKDAIPQFIAKQLAEDTAAISENWLKNNAFNTETYEEIFSLPQNKYYSLTFGDIRLVVLYVTNIWRNPNLEPSARGRYYENQIDLDRPECWGYGQHIFETIAQGSPQYQWLEKELNSREFQEAKYKVVMFHHPPHTLGGNIVPPYTDPVPTIERDATGKVRSVRYDYPQENDYIIRDLIPLLESAKVNLVFYGHSHLWNRFLSPKGMNFLESSNVGNSYGAHLGDKKRPVPLDRNYAAIGNPNGLPAIIPNIAPLVDLVNQPLPYIASNDLTVFSILDTEKGTVSSYRFDTRYPDSEVIKFDEFDLFSVGEI
ncbi:MAG: metallophosphoesterase family protein [Microcystis aeruginosa Ma_MB_F_20061100_S19]|uniref:Calcineurin-like phosphoesterase n=1 Tax=Microcystis aeruginosa SPC777 TaxID=482300 RepID=S3JDL3_MICAE|nr:metallophosphoesterase family protein [Microcystis aeruginosa]EPF23873.1 Calcineurin-like phosphoesterase [Microcystis aeruginosa SPC777]OCY15249.1 MAG: metallophosphoesterase [Microcystis aeruginosa CACIAM 03]TRU13881.1 MAG: metallophosphoesterase family protein [Microcystis aeruginosa Ma_MB_F_20061100_S19D]TRU14133.1 MAG: metallophosphoesterase family protein [Microcystis aeruginosa Ma_MB_F_20061100_S19]